MRTSITTLESEVAQIKIEAAKAYNAHRDAVDRLYSAERGLYEARRNGGN